jgi:peptide/nickel transport system permease protein
LLDGKNNNAKEILMPFQWVVLATDALLYALFIGLLIVVVWVRRHEQWRAPWQQVGRRRLAMVAFVVLAVFSLIALLDSLHFRLAVTQGDHQQRYYSANVVSVLDKLLSPLGEQYEQTYSAPLATHSFVKSIITLRAGQEVRVHPRLLYGGRHLESADAKAMDILERCAYGALSALVMWSLLLVVVVGWRAASEKRSWWQSLLKIKSGKTSFAWREVLLTLLTLMIVIGVAIALVQHYHVLGTDKVGADIFYQAIKSIRTGLVIGTVTTLVMLPFALLLGMMAGFFGGWIDDVIQYFYTTLSSIPGVLLISASVIALQVYIANHPDTFKTIAERADVRLLALCIILGVTSWTGLCRLLRAETLKIREMDYVRAATVLGVKRFKIILRHVLPNVLHIVLITVVLDFSSLVLAEAVLSYVGVGVDPTSFSWGNMINSSRLDLAREPVVWWPLFSAFIFMFSLVLAANLFADAVRDAFDPHLRDAH